MKQEPASPDEVLRAAEKILADLSTHRPAKTPLHLHDTLEKNLSLDSLARVEFLSRMENRFQCRFSEQDFAEIENLHDVFLKILKSQGLPPPPESSRESFGQNPQLTESAPPTLKTLVEVLDWHAQYHPNFIHVHFDEEKENHSTSLTYGELATRARAIAAGLQKRGLKKNDKMILMLPTGPEYLCSFFGVIYAGGVPVPIYPLARPNQLEDHIQRHRYILANSKALGIIAPAEIKPVARLLKFQTISLRFIASAQELQSSANNFQPQTHLPSDLTLLQYTSGSTGHPKGVQLTHANILSNIRAMGEALQVTPQDFFVSWLPLYHDMGLIGAWLGSLYFSVGLALMSPMSFLNRPERWLWALHRYKATLSAGPNFAYELCLHRIQNQNLQGLNLSSLRAFFNGAEAVSPDTLEAFWKRFQEFGLKRESIMPVYGLAESTVGLCFPPLARGFFIDFVDRSVFMREGKAVHVAPSSNGALRFVSCGVPLPEHQVRVVDAFQHELPENTEGEIEFRGPSATAGYFENPEQNKKLFVSNWLTTGDRGYFFRGELFITGRIKDIIIRGGQHIYPQEIEEAVGEIPGIRKGRTMAFGSRDPHSGTEKLIVVAETHETRTEHLQDLRNKINDLCMKLVGDPPEDVVLTAPGSILKTSSGKLRRAATRELYEKGRLGMPARALWIQILLLIAQGLKNNLRVFVASLLQQLYALYCWTLFVILAPIAWLLTMLLPSLNMRWACLRRLLKFFFAACGAKIHLIGDLSFLRRISPQIVVSNHASYLDPLVLVSLLP
ncbi:MAG: AMP-binding protein, partial [Pseudobdellovibrionaceae bacterium]